MESGFSKFVSSWFLPVKVRLKEKAVNLLYLRDFVLEYNMFPSFVVSDCSLRKREKSDLSPRVLCCLMVTFLWFYLSFFPSDCLIGAVNLKSSNRIPVVQEFESKYKGDCVLGEWAPSHGHSVVLQPTQHKHMHTHSAKEMFWWVATQQRIWCTSVSVKHHFCRPAGNAAGFLLAQIWFLPWLNITKKLLTCTSGMLRGMCTLFSKSSCWSSLFLFFLKFIFSQSLLRPGDR